jgi:hypothetical protein
MQPRGLRPIVAIALSLIPALARAEAPPDPNPFHHIDLAAMVSRSSDVRALAGGRLQVRRTGDTIARADIALDSLGMRASDGRYVLVVPFTNAAGADHSALVFAADATQAYQVGAFAARGDHLSISLRGAILVAFFARPSGARTYADGGLAPTSTAELALAGRRLVEIQSEAPEQALASASGGNGGP